MGTSGIAIARGIEMEGWRALGASKRKGKSFFWRVWQFCLGFLTSVTPVLSVFWQFFL